MYVCMYVCMYVQYVCTVCMYVFRYTHRMKSRIIALSFFCRLAVGVYFGSSCFGAVLARLARGEVILDTLKAAKGLEGVDQRF